jgi:hypothetical protein
MSPARIHRRRVGHGCRSRGPKLLALLAAGAAGWSVASQPPAAPAEQPGGRVELRVEGGRAVAGRVVVEAVDGSLLLAHDDDRYELFGPGEITTRAPVPGIPPEAARDLGQQVIATLPAGFDLLVTRHYVICFNTSRDYAKWCAALFERLHEAFGTYWSRAGIAVNEPPRPLVVVVFADRGGYEAHAAADLGEAAGRVVGYYNLLDNRVTTYDLTGTAALTAARGRPSGRASLDLLATPAAAGMVATIVHEATHQLAFNRGLHQRLAPVPLWVSEGVATYFETPDLESVRGWRGIGGINRPRLDHFLATYRPGTVAAILADDERFRQPDAALDAYAAAWAVTHHLLQTRKQAFIGYLRVLAAKPPLADDSPETRLREFRAAFGEPADVEQAVVKAASRLASRAR